MLASALAGSAALVVSHVTSGDEKRPAAAAAKKRVGAIASSHQATTMTGCPAVERTLIADETAAAEGASEYVSDASTLTEAAAIALLSARNPRFPKASPCLTIVTACQPNSEIAAATARATTSSGGATRSSRCRDLTV